ncbi:hypothetical protein PINS_up021612 [Pythium insidiosum]|nr:hypothetical protein PINS_up015339 [Pythium insidiosum]GLE09772.1 hypothetical protein PINS_up021612 [Pythium insidiosum]
MENPREMMQSAKGMSNGKIAALVGGGVLLAWYALRRKQDTRHLPSGDAMRSDRGTTQQQSRGTRGH